MLANIYVIKLDNIK